MAEEYGELVDECAETRRFIDEELHSQMKSLKKAFEVFFPEYNGSVFKLVSDLVYYQGGYPGENSPPKAETLGKTVSAALRLLQVLEKDQLQSIIQAGGVVTSSQIIEDGPVTDESWKEALDQWGQAMSDKRPKTRNEAFALMIKRAQQLQGEICAAADSIKITAAAEAKEKHGIEKGNFVKAVNIAAIGKKKSRDKMAEKVDEAVDNADNLVQALEPLRKEKLS